MCNADCFLALTALLFPPFPVWVKRGLCSADSIINIALCLLGVLPGIIHAWYIIFMVPDQYEYVRVEDVENGRTRSHQVAGVTYYYIQGPTTGSGQPASRQPEPRAQQQGYGSMNAVPGSSNATGEEVPPSYTEAIKGDNKVQKP